LHRALGIAKYGATVGVLCSDRLDLGPFRENAEKLPLGIHPTALTSRREYMLKAFRPSLDRSQRSRIRDILQQIQPDLLVLGQPGPDDCHTAILAANDLKIPVVADVALLLDPALMPMKGGGLRRWWIRRHYALCRSVVTNCRRNAELLEDLGCGSSEHFEVIPTGIHAQDFPPCSSPEIRSRVREEIGLTPDRWAIGFVGRLSIEKGLDWLIEAFGVARKQHPSMELILIGDGPLRTSLQEQAEQTDIPIHFLGWRSEISELLWGLDAFILPSKIEAFPRVIMQAFSARIPVIATRVHGVPDMVRDGETGWLVEYGDTHQLVSTLAEISNNPEESLRRVDAAQALVHSELDLDHQQAKFAAYLKNLLLQKDS
ncbi:MAG: glycosyltransferase family 4 protein, partial [Planctomycetota bacterium]|nr:glycosyltransferase family 4 protein [Planctomycetota bacterium]